MNMSWGQTPAQSIGEDFKPKLSTKLLDITKGGIHHGYSTGYYDGARWITHGIYHRDNVGPQTFWKFWEFSLEEEILLKTLFEIEPRFKPKDQTEHLAKQYFGEDNLIEMSYQHGLPEGKITITNNRTKRTILEGELKQIKLANGEIIVRPVGKFSVWSGRTGFPLMVKYYSDAGELNKTIRYIDNKGINLIKDESGPITKLRYFNEKKNNWFRRCEAGQLKVQYDEGFQVVKLVGAQEKSFQHFNLKNPRLINLFAGDPDQFLNNKDICQQIIDEIMAECDACSEGLADSRGFTQKDINQNNRKDFELTRYSYKPNVGIQME